MPGVVADRMSSTRPPTAWDGLWPERLPRSLKRRVLLADPCEDNLMSSAIMLRLWGHDVRGVTSGLGALEMARTYQPDAVVLEIALPQIDGLEVARRLRRRKGGEDLLLIAVTGYGDEATRKKVNDAGFDWHFVKPADPGELQRLLTTPPPAFQRTQTFQHAHAGGASGTSEPFTAYRA